jgi:hypothetical protein
MPPLFIDCPIDRAVEEVALGLKAIAPEEPSPPKLRRDRIALKAADLLYVILAGSPSAVKVA